MISIERTSEHFRLLYNTKGRFAVHRIREEEAEYKLCRVRKVLIGAKGIPYLVTHDGRTIRYPNPDIKANDTVQVDVETGRIQSHLKFETGQLVMITCGHNVGRVGVLVSREISHIQDTA